MRIDRITCETTDDRTRLSARLVWEDRRREDDTLWYEWPSTFAEEVAPAAAAMLVAALPLALVSGERRVTMDAPVCALLYDHLRNVLGLFCAWYPRLTALALDVPRESSSPAPVPNESRRAAICLSGGVDSLAALVENHAALAPGHPERMRDAIYMFGLNTYDFENGSPVDARVSWYREYGRRLTEFCEHNSLALLSVATNVRSLYADWATWSDVGQASALSVVGHAMPRRIHALTIAGGGAGADGAMSGTEPSLDPLYSSYSLDVRTVHGTVSRIEKIRLIASDAEALGVLRVCLTFDVPARRADGAWARENINCGRCEKCIRTMLVLMICDALDRTPTFPGRQVTPEMVEGLKIDPSARRQLALYRSMLGPLSERGHADLVRTLEHRLDELGQELLARRPKSLVQRLLRG